MWDSRKKWRCHLFGCVPLKVGADTVYCGRCKRIIHIGIKHFLPNEYDAYCSSLLRMQKINSSKQKT